jgi:O-antigen/teichoic acid export membrane protein
MLPESDEEAINLLALSITLALIVTIITIPLIYIFKESIILAFKSPQLGIYLWLVPPFVLVNGIFMALNFWNSRTKHFKRLSFATVSKSFTSAGTQIGAGVLGFTTGFGLILGNLIGRTVSTVVLGWQIWGDDGTKFKKNINSIKMIDGLKKYRKFPLVDSWSSLLNVTSWQLPAFLLAFFFSPSIVGFYSLGLRLIQMPMNFIGGSISKVFFQRATIANSENTLDILVENVFKLLVVIGLFPILTVTIIGSDLFSILFGQEWTEAGVYAQILSIWAFLWFISSPLSTIYIVKEKQLFGLKYNIFNIITRFLSLAIGGLLGNARISLILFAASGILVYGYLCLKMLSYSGIKTSRAINIVISNMSYFIPVGFILIMLKIAAINQVVIVGVASLSILSYYLYMIKTDEQFHKIIKGVKISKFIYRN